MQFARQVDTVHNSCVQVMGEKHNMKEKSRHKNCKLPKYTLTDATEAKTQIDAQGHRSYNNQHDWKSQLQSTPLLFPIKKKER